VVYCREKIWIETGLSNHLKVYKWVPVREDTKEEGKEGLKKSVDEAKTLNSGGDMEDSALPEIVPAQVRASSLESSRLATDQLPPDLLLASDEATSQDATPTTVTSEQAPGRGVATADGGVDSSVGGEAAVDSEQEVIYLLQCLLVYSVCLPSTYILQKVDWERRRERQQAVGQVAGEREKPRSPH
jgi:hypothetical protein